MRFVLALFIATLIIFEAETASRRREITITCDDIKIVFEVADKAKWSLKLVTDKKGTPYNCQIVADK